MVLGLILYIRGQYVIYHEAFIEINKYFFISRLESQHQSVPGCAEECGDPLVQSGGLWQTLGVAAGLSAGPQVQKDPGLASEGVLRLCTHLSLSPPSSTVLNPLDYFVWSYVKNIINMTSQNTKASLIAAIHRVKIRAFTKNQSYLVN